MNKRNLLIVEDDHSFGVMLRGWLERSYTTVMLCSNLRDAKNEFGVTKFDLVISDLRLPDGDGIDLLQWIGMQKVQVPFIIMTSYGEVSTAVSAMKLGAKDYLEKPINPNILKEKIENILNRDHPQTFNEVPSKGVMGKSEPALLMYEYIIKVAPTNMSVLILGESGTGKEYAARMVHENSKRKDNPFIAIDCGSLSKELAPSELFGHVKGSFTSAMSDKKGVFESAAKGTVFLDEVGNLSYEVQVQLLRALQEKKIRPVGANKDINIDVRIISATNENLENAIAEGRFREDLFHRLNEFTVSVPPLRERKGDIPIFVSEFLRQANEELDKNILGFSKEALSIMEKQYWSGNLRELRNVVRRAALFASEDEITADDLPSFPSAPVVADDFSLRSENEAELIETALRRARGNKTLAAQLLKIDRKTLYNKMHLYDIKL